MKKTSLVIALVLTSLLGYAQDPLFFFSSDKLIQEKQAPLKEMLSFVFFPLLKMEEKNTTKISEMIEQELKKVGNIVKKPALTPEGADLECYSNPSLQFTIEQLVDQNNKPLPVLQAILSINTTAELLKAKELVSINTNHWSVYLEKTDNVQEVIKKTFPSLLKQFIADFQRDNASDQKPTFYITYDSSWLKS